ncbi:GW domain-containing glycosaminoglycan-binding protein [Bacillus cytotoxicus]|uniref:GW domain-containing glycosaminoglycan-binding protein n=1 Tax=Bacillus cytotoxicus TaxID=580165 RepID=A0ACC6AAR2_9BACI|nr:GW domain-containing glycosaminoglycan-binding protein [Bacillus cytotoxicus]
MKKTNKLKKRSKTVTVLGTAGVCLLLASPIGAKAETVQTPKSTIQNNQTTDTTKVNSLDKNKTGLKKEDFKDTGDDIGTVKKVEENKDKSTSSKQKETVSPKDKTTDSNSEKKYDSLKSEEKTKTVIKPNEVKPTITEPTISDVNEIQTVVNSKGDGIWSQPYGLQGANYVGSVNNYTDKDVKLIKKMVLNNVTWYQFSYEGKTIGWLDSKVLSKSPTRVQINQDSIIGRGTNDGVWSLPFGVSGANYVTSVSDFAFESVKLTEKTVVNGQTWYKFSVNGKSIGWLHDKVLDKGEVKPENFTVTIGNSDWHSLWTKPHGLPSAKYVGSTSKFAYQTVQVVKSVKIDKTTWYQVKNDKGIIGWIDGNNALVDAKPADFTVTLGNSDWHSIWTNPYGTPNSNYVGGTSKFAYQKVQVIKTVKIDNTNWYQIKNNNGIIGWVDGGRALSDAEGLPIDSNTALVKGNLDSRHGVWTVPYGEAGANWVSAIRDYSCKPVRVTQKVKKGNTVWSKIQSGDRVIGWVDSQTLINQTINEENKTVMIGDVNGHAIWSMPYGIDGAKYVSGVREYENKIVKIDKSIQLGSTLWYHMIVNGKDIGWLDSKLISSATNVQEKGGTYHISTSESRHGLWSRPYGVQNASWVGSAVDNKNKNLKLKMSINLNGVTWYAFDKGNGNVFWVDSSAVSEGHAFPRLDVPIIEQRDAYNPARDLVYGCEITAVTMMLQYAGANVDKVQLANEMPYHPFDPNQGFVGDPWGDGRVNTIYPPALMGLVNKYTGTAVNLTGQEIKRNLDNDKPVVVWLKMHGFGVHAITLTGYDDNAFYYNDPWTGEKEASMHWSTFYNSWDTQKRRAISY